MKTVEVRGKRRRRASESFKQKLRKTKDRRQQKAQQEDAKKLKAEAEGKESLQLQTALEEDARKKLEARQSAVAGSLQVEAGEKKSLPETAKMANAEEAA